VDANGAPTLSDPSGPRLVLACAKCGRRGSYAVAKLIERHGDMTLVELGEWLTADCPKLKARNFEDWRAARFDAVTAWRPCSAVNLRFGNNDSCVQPSDRLLRDLQRVSPFVGGILDMVTDAERLFRLQKRC
jgi:hypothetical protein